MKNYILYNTRTKQALMHPHEMIWSTTNLQEAKDLLYDIQQFSTSADTEYMNKFLMVKEIQELDMNKLQKKEDNFWLSL